MLRDIQANRSDELQSSREFSQRDRIILESVLKVDELWHRYSGPWALKGISFSFTGKGVIGLLGSNGAGKSTLMNIVSGCLHQTRGAVEIDGLDAQCNPLEVRGKIGFLPQQAPLSFELTIEEYLSFCAGIRRISQSDIEDAVNFVIERCRLTSMRKRLVGSLSGGYRQRVGIAQALIHKPPLIVLDEPTVGLDPNQLDGVRELITEIGRDHTVIFSTHIMSEIEILCRDVLMIENGTVVFHDSIDRFRALSKSHLLLLVCQTTPSVDQLRGAHPGIEDVEVLSRSRYRVHTNGDRDVGRALIEHGESQGWGIEELCFERASIEGVFKQLSRESLT